MEKQPLASKRDLCERQVVGKQRFFLKMSNTTVRYLAKNIPTAWLRRRQGVSPSFLFLCTSSFSPLPPGHYSYAGCAGCSPLFSSFCLFFPLDTVQKCVSVASDKGGPGLLQTLRKKGGEEEGLKKQSMAFSQRPMKAWKMTRERKDKFPEKETKNLKLVKERLHKLI